MIKYYIDTKEFTNFSIFRQDLIKKLNNRVSVPNLEMLVFKKENVEYYKDNFGIEIRKEIIPTPVPTPEELLAKAKERKIEELKIERNKKEKEDVTTDKGTFDFNDDSRDRINGAITVLEDNKSTTLEWTLADNEIVTVDYNDLKNVIISAGIRCNMLHEKYRTLKDMVNEATTVEDVDKISWDIINE